MTPVKEAAPLTLTRSGAFTNYPCPTKMMRQPQSVKGSQSGEVKLRQSFKSGGFQFRIIDRMASIAVLEKCRHKGTAVSFEVVRIRRIPARIIDGKLHPVSEALPPSARWGVDGWTYPDLNRALAKYRLLVEKQECAALCTPPTQNGEYERNGGCCHVVA